VFRLEGEGYNVITATGGEAAVETAVDAGFCSAPTTT
jgi:hypothetical protein